MSRKRKYYGQYGDDCLLWQLFGNKSSGYFVDVGAFDGIHLSNSYSFELEGWSGLCIEALPEMFGCCKKSRPGTKCVEAACVGADDIGEVNFVVEKLGLLSGLSVGENEEEIRRRYKNRGLEFDGFKKITVPARTLNSILEEHKDPDQCIDFISIDVEGSEMDVLKGFDIEEYAPRCIVIEANTAGQHSAIVNYLSGYYDYILARELGCNLFFVRSKYDAITLKNAEIDCIVEPTTHPLGNEYTLRGHIDGFVINRRISIFRRIVNIIKILINIR